MQSLVFATVLLALILLGKWWERRKQRSPQKTKDPLDKPLLFWTKLDALTVRDLLNGGVAITGRAGSGKTSSSGKQLGKAIVGHEKSGGLILAAKPEDLKMWEGIFEAAERKDDLIVFGPDRDRRFNFLDYVLKSGGSTREVVRCITTIGETLRSSDTKGGENADFFEKEQDRMIHNTVDVVKHARGEVTAPEMQKFILTAPMSANQIATEEWRKGFCNQCLGVAFGKPKSAIEAHDFQLAADYWLTEFPGMADKTRSSIMTGVMGILHTFNMGIVRELVSTTTNVSPDDILAGKWVLIDMAPAEWGDSGALVAAGWKYLVQRRVLRRAAAVDDNIVVIWADEYHQFVNSYDSRYLAQCRSHLGCMVVLTQSLASFYAALHGESGKYQTEALLTNFQHRIYHALGDEQTAKWAQGMIGRRRKTLIGTSLQQPGTWQENDKMSTSTSEHMDMVLETNVFMNGLRCGGIASDCICDGIVMRTGVPFVNGENWLLLAFPQE